MAAAKDHHYIVIDTLVVVGGMVQPRWVCGIKHARQLKQSVVKMPRQ